MLITCPSGLSFHARKWIIRDRRVLQNPQILKQGLLLRKMLECVDEGVEAPGPYQVESGKKMTWGKAALADIVDALLTLRIKTRPEYDFNEPCRGCGASIPITVDLRKLEFTPMSAEAKQHLATGDPIVIQAPLLDADSAESGAAIPKVDVKLRVLRGDDLITISKFYKQSPDEVQEAQMVLHITELTTPDGLKFTKFKDIQEFYANQEWCFHEALDAEVEKIGGGLNTVIDMSCKRCNTEQQGVLPFAEEFFFPRRTSSTSSMATL